ncbi:MAG TPA: hypothetical protein VIL99_01105 [Ignavibacteria bacterium]
MPKFSLKCLQIFLIITGFLFLSCNKDQNNKDKVIVNETDIEEPDDTVQLTPAESFSSALIDVFIDESNDEDLLIYLEEEIFPLVSKSDKVTFDKISASLYLLSYDEGNELKNILIRKIYNPQKDEIVFQKENVEFDAKKFFLK